MKHTIAILMLISCLNVNAQTYNDLDSADRAKVDSIVLRHKLIQASASHGKMVSFSEWNVNDLTPFFNYLVEDLNYGSNGGGTIKTRNVNFKKTANGYYTDLYKYNGYGSAPAKLTVSFNCKADGSKIIQTKIVAPFNLLAEIYLSYFEGRVQPDLPAKGGLDKMYTATDEVRIYPTYILITPHNNKLSKD